jgi:predicted regulator of Ras-like GTPase activity (Roadblock/LC7/MglB family)
VVILIDAISKILTNLSSDPGVKLVVLYRIDGVPISLKVNMPMHELASFLYWLENQIREMLLQIFNRNLDEASFKLGDKSIHMYPVSRTLVLGIMASEEASTYKLEIDVKTVCKQLREVIRYEG